MAKCLAVPLQQNVDSLLDTIASTSEHRDCALQLLLCTNQGEQQSAV